MGQNSYTQKQLSFSKNCLFDALVGLLEEKELYEISVTDLTQRAGISRSTFYRNYKTPEDIITEFLDSMPMGFPKTIRVEEYTAFQVVEHYFDYLLANRKFFSILQKRNLFHYMLEELDRTFAYGPFEPYVHKFGFHSKYEVSMFIGGVYKVTYDWIAGGMQESREQMIDISTRLITSFSLTDEPLF